MTELTHAQEAAIIECLKLQLGAYTVILFGSAACGRLRPDSDVDIAYLSDQASSPYERFMIAGELAACLGRDVDLVDLNEVSTVFQAQIVTSGILLADDRPVDRQYVFMRVLKAYAMLNEERAPILKMIADKEANTDHV